MNLRKSKKFVLKILLSVLLVSTVLITLPNNNITYATSHTCLTGWTAEGTNQCTKTGAASEPCPAGFSGPVVNGDKIVCTKIVATPQDSQAQIDRAKFLLSVQAFLNKAIWPILILIGGLMDNSLLFGSGMEEHLRDIWIPIRNIVNILFVIILVGIALYNVLGIGDENSEYSIKSVLPKIIIGIIAVNFSFLGIKVFLDAINVLTVSVFSLPGQVNEGLEQIISDDPNDKVAKNVVDKLCRNIQGFTTNEFTAGDEILQQQAELDIYRTLGPRYLGPAFKPNMSKADIDAAIVSLGGDNKVSFDRGIEQYKKAEICNGAHELTATGKLFLSRWNSRNAALALALNMGKIVFYEDLPFDSLKSVEKLTINTLFSVLLYLVYVASFLALFAVLLARLVVLWLSIAVSPVLLLMIAAPSLKDKFGEAFGKIQEQFVKNAIAPLLIALAMTVGWIMLKALQGANFIDSTSSFGVSQARGIPVVGLSTLQDLIVALGTVGIVWLGVFSAAEGTLAQVATDAMKGFLENAGKWIGSLPFKHIPFIPVKVPGAEGEESYTGTQVWEGMKSVFDTGRTEKDLKLVRAMKLDGASDPSEISDADTKDEVLRGIGKASQAGKLDGAAYQNALKEYRTSHGPDFADLDAPDKFNSALGRLADAPDDKTRKEIAREIKKKIADNPDLRAALPATKPGASGKPAAPAGPTIGTLKPETEYRDGKTIKEIVDKAEKDKGSSQEIADQQLNAGISLFNRNLNELAGQLDMVSRTDMSKLKPDQIANGKASIKQSFDQLTIGGQRPTKETLTTLLGGPNRYKYLEQAIGQRELNSLLGTTPPATGGPPSP